MLNILLAFAGFVIITICGLWLMMIVLIAKQMSGYHYDLEV